MNLAFSRNYGRPPTKERAKEGRKDVRFEREPILSTLRLNGETCPFVFSETLNKELFAKYIETRLKSSLAADDILILDNFCVIVLRKNIVRNGVETKPGIPGEQLCFFAYWQKKGALFAIDGNFINTTYYTDPDERDSKPCRVNIETGEILLAT